MMIMCLGLLMITVAIFSSNVEAAESQFQLNCTNFTQQQLESLNLARGISGIICLIITMLVLVLLLLNKAFKTILQRLFLYLTAMTVFLEFCISLQTEHYFFYTGQEQFCEALGFISQVASGVVYTFTVEIVIYLLLIVYYRFKGQQYPFAQSSCLNTSLEWIFLAIAFVFPLTYMWVPFLDRDYGLNSYICWIKSVGDNCEEVGVVDQAIITAFGYMLNAIIVIATIVLSVMYCTMSYRYRKMHSPQMKRLLRQTLALSVAVVTGLVSVTAISIVYIIVSFSVHREIYALWLINAAGIPFSLPVTSVIFLAYVYATRNRERKNRFWTSCLQCCQVRRPQNHSQFELRVVSANQHRTNPHSVHETVPSETYFNIEYTGHFTDVNNTTENANGEERLPKVTTDDHIKLSYFTICCKSLRNTDTTSKSDPPSPIESGPSHTFFNIEYTGQFTEIHSHDAQVEPTSPETTKNTNLLTFFSFCCDRHESDDEGSNDNNDSSSIYQSDPSSTFFNIEYTGQFTDIGDATNGQGVPKVVTRDKRNPFLPLCCIKGEND